MLKCPSCSVEIKEADAPCPSCGVALEEYEPTRLLTDAPTTADIKSGSSHQKKSSADAATRSPASFDSIDDARFIPGTILAERYRIVGLLGRGGMGEVYRADDLKLKQAVALKFLPESISMDGAALARFYREVSTARQVSHKNVCRVYDIGEISGQHFLSMEFIKGEELASLLKRIGRLPSDKATEIARQLCAGLAAIHERGILHRDLKPANVMLDENGDVRITDFGLAELAEELRGEGVIAGTPSYMSPEQLAGRQLTIKSDIYSLGLVLYEIFTGRRAFDAKSIAELQNIHRTDATPTSPSSLVKEIDPLAERVILRCLEREPEKRPASALQVAAALPGGDPLAAALAAGETPSPEMVAAAPKEGVLKPAVAAALLASVLVGLALLMWLSGRVMLYRQVPLDKSPEVLKERAVEIAHKLGYTETPSDSFYGLYLNTDYIRFIREHDQSRTRWAALKEGRPTVFFFRYRQSPRYLVSFSHQGITNSDPPPNFSGMLGMSLDTRGRMGYFYAVPPQVDDGQNAAKTPDWAALFQAAELSINDFTPTESLWTPPQVYDTRMAWKGVFPEHPEIPIRVEAAGYRGRATYFEIVVPWDAPARQQPFERTGQEWLGQALGIVIFFSVLIGGVLLAQRNLRLGRGDRRGAFRLGLYVFIVFIMSSAFGIHHVPIFDEFNQLIPEALKIALYFSVLMGLVYIALEPFVRKRWPQLLISWNRLLSGDVRDPLIGRDLLIGALFGVGLALICYVWTLAPQWLGWPPDAPYTPLEPYELIGVRGLMSYIAVMLSYALVLPLIHLFILLLLSIILRKNWLAVGSGALLFAFAVSLGGSYPSIDWFFAGLTAALYTFVFIRHGLLAAIFTYFFLQVGISAPLTWDFSTWYAANTIAILFVTLALLIYGFYTSLAGQKLFKGSLLQD